MSIGFAALTLALGVYLRESSEIWVTAFLFIFSAVSFVGTAESLISRLVLGDDRLTIHGLLSKREIEKSEIESVRWERGCGAHLKLQDGRSENIPDFGNAQSVTNSIRAWLKK